MKVIFRFKNLLSHSFELGTLAFWFNIFGLSHSYEL